MKTARIAQCFWALILCFLSANFAMAQAPQGHLSLTLTVLDNHGKPLAATEIEFIETQTRERYLQKTDAEGKLAHTFTSGRFWQMNVNQVRDYFFWQLEVMPGKNMKLSKTITYDFKRYERESRPPVDRTKLGIKTEAQKFSPDIKPTTGLGLIKLEVVKGNDQPLLNYPIAVTCYKIGKTFTTNTNAAGIATFMVPLDNEYEIDIDGIASYDYIDLPNVSGYRGTRHFTYEPTIIKEKVVRDTVEQFLDPAQEGTSGSVITHLTMKGGPDGVWKSEPVFLEVIGEKKWYRGKTDLNGVVTFLLPKGKKYMIHGRYEFDLDVVDLRRRRGIGYSTKTVRYNPQEKYQFPDKFIPRPEQLAVDAFTKFLERQYVAPESDDAVNPLVQWGGPINANSQEAVLRLAFVTGAEAEKSLAPPLNLAIVIDKSGSMSGHDRIDQLKLSLVDFVQSLRKVDVISLTIFEDFETVLVPAQAIGENKALIVQLIERIEADGGTNIFKGMQAGYKELQKNFKAGSTNRMILLTDGYDGTPIEDFIKMQTPYTDKGMECSAVGVGEDYNVALLTQLATRGGGLLEHVGDARGMRDVFVEQLSAVLYPVAKNLEVEVLFNKHLEYKQLLGFPITEKGPNRLKIKLKNMYAGLNQLAFIRFKVLNPMPSAQNEPVTIKLKYTDLRTNKVVEQVVESPLKWSEGSGEMELLMEQQEKKMYAVAVMNASLKAMSDKFHSGDQAGAKAALQDGLASLKKVFPGAQDADLTALKDQLEQYLDVLMKQR
jgi:Ca-activated chloride channel family protein